VQRELSEPALIKTNTDSISNLWRYLQMNIELIKQFADLTKDLREQGVFGIQENKLQVRTETLVTLPNLQIEVYPSATYPYKVFIEVDGILVFSILTSTELEQFPQFKQFRRNELQKQLAYLEAELKAEEKEEELA
jgi:hypothetical protein